MSEEEKKAIEKFNNLFQKSLNGEKITDEDRLDYIDFTLISSLFDKYEKLQKENEELKEDNLGIREENIKLVNCHISYERYTGLDFLLPDKFKYAIPKDKIREKIETLKKEATDRLNEGRENIFVTKRLIIDILEELLEEE